MCRHFERNFKKFITGLGDIRDSLFAFGSFLGKWHLRIFSERKKLLSWLSTRCDKGVSSMNRVVILVIGTLKEFVFFQEVVLFGQ
jgi:hypothetical protein